MKSDFWTFWRIKSGRYRAPPVRRAYTPKADGSKDARHSGLRKVAQRAVTMVLETIYEEESTTAHSASDWVARPITRPSCRAHCGQSASFGLSIPTYKNISTRSRTIVCGGSSTSESRRRHPTNDR